MSEAIASSHAPAEPARPVANPQRALLGVGLLPFVALAIAGAGLLFGLRGDELRMHLLAVLTGTLCFLPPVADRLRSPEKRHVFLAMFAPVFAVYFVFGVYTEYFFYPETEAVYGSARLIKMQPSTILMGQVAALLGLVSVLLGFWLPIGSLLARLVPDVRMDWPLGSTLRVGLTLSVIGWVLFLAGQFGALPAFLGSGFLGAFAASFYFGASVLMIAWLRYGARSALLVMAALIPPAMFFAFFTGSKKLFLSPLAIVAVTHIMYTRKLRVSYLAAGGLILVLIYPVSQFYRDVLQVGNQLGAVQVLSNPQRVINGLSTYLANVEPTEYVFGGLRAASSRLSALGILSVIVRDTPDIVPFQGGWTIGHTIIAFVPRVLWPGKPRIGIGQWVTDNYGGGTGVRSNTGSSWIGELYLNFGWTGIAVGMLLLGVFFRFLQDAFMRSTSAVPVVLAGVVVLWTLLPGLQGTLQVPLNGVAFSMIPVFFSHMLVRLFFGGVPYRGPATRA